MNQDDIDLLQQLGQRQRFELLAAFEIPRVLAEADALNRQLREDTRVTNADEPCTI